MLNTQAQSFSLAIHGGAGRLVPKNFSAERAQKYELALDSALQLGYALLADSATSIEVCEAVTMYLENNPLFNAGRGAVFNAAGGHEMDASIMDGATLQAGAVSGVSSAKNPVQVARLVMDSTSHVMLGGAGAESFIQSMPIETKPASYFDTERRRKQLEKAKKKEQMLLDHSSSDITETDEEYKYGTVGVVALDVHGNLAAATSTGGLTNKRFGRIGDSPIVGAGVYANNQTCAVSCTGYGEFFIRTLAAFEVHALMRYKKKPAQKAANTVIHKRVGAIGGKGGMIVMDRKGKVSFAFNTEGMYRGSINQKGEKFIGMFSAEKPLLKP